MSNNNTQLPVEVVKKIWFEAEKYAEEKVKAVNEDHFNVYNAYIAGATAYATKLLQADKANGSLEETNRGLVEQNKELQRQNDKMKAMATGWRPLLEKVIHRHEGGLLPDRILYLEIKTFLYGE